MLDVDGDGILEATDLAGTGVPAAQTIGSLSNQPGAEQTIFYNGPPPVTLNGSATGTSTSPFTFPRPGITATTVSVIRRAQATQVDGSGIMALGAVTLESEMDLKAADLYLVESPGAGMTVTRSQVAGWDTSAATDQLSFLELGQMLGGLDIMPALGAVLIGITSTSADPPVFPAGSIQYWYSNDPTGALKTLSAQPPVDALVGDPVIKFDPADAQVSSATAVMSWCAPEDENNGYPPDGYALDHFTVTVDGHSPTSDGFSIQRPVYPTSCEGCSGSGAVCGSLQFGSGGDGELVTGATYVFSVAAVDSNGDEEIVSGNFTTTSTFP